MNLFIHIGMIKGLYHILKDEKLIPDDVLDSLFNDSLRVFIETDLNESNKIDLLREKYDRFYECLKYFLNRKDIDYDVELEVDGEKYKYYIFDDSHFSLVRSDYKQVLIRTKVVENDYVEYLTIESDPVVIFEFVFGIINFEILKLKADNIYSTRRYFGNFDKLYIK